MQKIPKRFEVAKKMPPLKHNDPAGNLDPQKSEVIHWLIAQPDILNYIFDAVRGNGHRESLIVYDSDTGMWRGVDYNDD